jgi:hypothetical protein
MFRGKVNTGTLTTLEPDEATAGAWLTNGAAARPTPSAAAAVTVRSLDRMKGTLNARTSRNRDINVHSRRRRNRR